MLCQRFVLAVTIFARCDLHELHLWVSSSNTAAKAGNRRVTTHVVNLSRVQLIQEKVDERQRKSSDSKLVHGSLCERTVIEGQFNVDTWTFLLSEKLALHDDTRTVLLMEFVLKHNLGHPIGTLFFVRRPVLAMSLSCAKRSRTCNYGLRRN